jgi:hypothetical protein
MFRVPSLRRGNKGLFVGTEAWIKWFHVEPDSPVPILRYGNTIARCYCMSSFRAEGPFVLPALGNAQGMLGVSI